MYQNMTKVGHEYSRKPKVCNSAIHRVNASHHQAKKKKKKKKTVFANLGLLVYEIAPSFWNHGVKSEVIVLVRSIFSEGA